MTGGAKNEIPRISDWSLLPDNVNILLNTDDLSNDLATCIWANIFYSVVFPPISAL